MHLLSIRLKQPLVERLTTLVEDQWLSSFLSPLPFCEIKQHWLKIFGKHFFNNFSHLFCSSNSTTSFLIVYYINRAGPEPENNIRLRSQVSLQDCVDITVPWDTAWRLINQNCSFSPLTHQDKHCCAETSQTDPAFSFS